MEINPVKEQEREKEQPEPCQRYKLEEHVSFLSPEEQDKYVDEQGRESFPASDPPGNY